MWVIFVFIFKHHYSQMCAPRLLVRELDSRFGVGCWLKEEKVLNPTLKVASEKAASSRVFGCACLPIFEISYFIFYSSAAVRIIVEPCREIFSFDVRFVLFKVGSENYTAA